MRFFITSSSSLPCATACIAGSVQWNGACVSCAKLLPPPPVGAPFNTYYSLFAAKNGKRWWPEAFDPPHLPLRAATLGDTSEVRAGVCWPCPIGTPFPLPHSLEVQKKTRHPFSSFVGFSYDFFCVL
jgi:hypothetical protein